MKILVTPRSFASTSTRPLDILKNKGYQLIMNDTGKPLDNQQMAELIADVDGVIIGIDQLKGDLIKKASNLKVISKYGVGVDNIDIKTATEKGIMVTNTPEANVDAVADLAFGLMLALARKIPEADRETKAGNWKKFIGSSVWKKKLGVVGLGKIGKQLVKRARGFEMEILGYDLYPDEQFTRKYNLQYVSLEALLTNSDYISIHLPLNKATSGLISGSELGLMKKDAFLINTSRGGIVDEKALYEALKDNKIQGAALDAYEQEPPTNSPLKNLDNIILTSHNGAYTEEAIAMMGTEAAQNLIDVLEGKKPKHCLNCPEN